MNKIAIIESSNTSENVQLQMFRKGAEIIQGAPAFKSDNTWFINYFQ